MLPVAIDTVPVRDDDQWSRNLWNSTFDVGSCTIVRSVDREWGEEPTRPDNPLNHRSVDDRIDRTMERISGCHRWNAMSNRSNGFVRLALDSTSGHEHCARSASHCPSDLLARRVVLHRPLDCNWRRSSSLICHRTLLCVVLPREYVHFRFRIWTDSCRLALIYTGLEWSVRPSRNWTCRRWTIDQRSLSDPVDPVYSQCSICRRYQRSRYSNENKPSRRVDHWYGIEYCFYSNADIDRQWWSCTILVVWIRIGYNVERVSLSLWTRWSPGSCQRNVRYSRDLLTYRTRRDKVSPSQSRRSRPGRCETRWK